MPADINAFARKVIANVELAIVDAEGSLRY